MIIRIELDDGSELLMTAEELAVKFLEALQSMRAVPEVQPARCPICQFGRIGTDYCTCPLGRDLKRIETKVPNPVGGMDDSEGTR